MKKFLNSGSLKIASPNPRLRPKSRLEVIERVSTHESGNSYAEYEEFLTAKEPQFQNNQTKIIDHLGNYGFQQLLHTPTPDRQTTSPNVLLRKTKINNNKSQRIQTNSIEKLQTKSSKTSGFDLDIELSKKISTMRKVNPNTSNILPSFIKHGRTGGCFDFTFCSKTNSERMIDKQNESDYILESQDLESVGARNQTFLASQKSLALPSKLPGYKISQLKSLYVKQNSFLRSSKSIQNGILRRLMTKSIHNQDDYEEQCSLKEIMPSQKSIKFKNQFNVVGHNQVSLNQAKNQVAEIKEVMDEYYDTRLKSISSNRNQRQLGFAKQNSIRFVTDR